MSTNEWLPPGWTEEMLQTATDEQWDALTQEQYDRITAHQLAQSRAVHAENELLFNTAALSTNPTAGAAQQSLAHTSATREPGMIEANIVDALQQTGLRDFGFVVFRATGEGDSNEESERRVALERRWTKLASDGRIRPEIADGVGQVATGPDEHGRPWPVWMWDDAQVIGAGGIPDVGAVRTRFEELCDGTGVGAGLDTGVALVITKEVVNALEDGEGEGAWVWVVNLGHEEGDTGDEEQPLKGYFKASVRSLLPDLWPTLALQIQEPWELEVAAGDDGIWESVF